MRKFLAASLAVGVLVPTVFAGGRNPGSALVYPVHRSGLFNDPQTEEAAFFTIVSVTNSNLTPATPFSFGGSTNVQFDYVNVMPDPANPLKPFMCTVNDVVEFLTPADTLSVLTSCHNAVFNQEGYLVVHAQDPAKFKTAWSWNYLMGSEMVITTLGGVYSINAIPFESPLADGEETDLDGDGQLDFDDAEYEALPDTLYIDAFLGIGGSSLTLINLTGGVDFLATVKFDIWNDNEFPLSTTIQFKCWFEEALTDVSLVFSEDFLENNTPNDPEELDIDCDNYGELETGWAIINGLVASSTAETIPNPALLGAVTSGPAQGIDGGRLLWESTATQLNGDFLKFGVDDPEN